MGYNKKADGNGYCRLYTRSVLNEITSSTF